MPLRLGPPQRHGTNRRLQLELCASWVVHRIREMLKSGPGIEAGIAQQGAAYYPTVMTTISLTLPENLLARLERESRARCTTKSSVLRESLAEST